MKRVSNYAQTTMLERDEESVKCRVSTIISHGSRNGYLLTPLHSVKKVPSLSVNYLESRHTSCSFCRGQPHDMWCSLQFHGAVFLWK